MKKIDIRRQMLKRRRAMPPSDVAAKSAAITERLYALDAFKTASAVLTYVSSKDNEVDTQPLIARLLEEGRDVLVPIAEPGGRMPWSRLEALEELVPARFGILEPAPSCRRITEPPPDAICLVPGLAFTRTGHRIGYGGGYFDRFLSGFCGIPVALAFELELVEPFPLQPHDVPMHIIVTESATYQCQGG